jgi:hypothetical protein
MKFLRTHFLCALLGMVAAAPASAIFKCDVGGKVSYSDTACDGGKVIDIGSGRSGDAISAERQATQEKDKLKTLERERHRREAADERDLRKASRESAKRNKKCDTHIRRQKQANENIAKSTGAANEKAKLKAQRVTEAYEAECGRWYERELSLAR